MVMKMIAYSFTGFRLRLFISYPITCPGLTKADPRYPPIFETETDIRFPAMSKDGFRRFD
jgi:hypothetical protein